MKKRNNYLNQLKSYRDKPFIKIITGLRRCGKSTLLSLFEENLKENQVHPDRIIRMNFESMSFDEVQDYRDLYKYVKATIIDNNSKNYILLDEVQMVSSWEKAVNSFLVDFNVDIYITGSNSYLLSSELSTLLSGRYVEIKMLPLSFKEYLAFRNSSDKNIMDQFNDYLRYGGMPNVVDLINTKSTIGPFLEGIYNTVLIKDIIKRNNIRDAALLENVLTFIADNVGNIISSKKISDYLTSKGRKTTHETIDNYLRMLESAFIIYKAKRYDLKGKLFLKTLEKYYLVDMGIRNQLTGFRNANYGFVLENIVYLELLRRDYNVSIGKIGDLEVDFIATKTDEKAYFQVSASIIDSAVKERELRPLKTINDNYPKYILTMDEVDFGDFSGIKVKNIIDFLLEWSFSEIEKNTICFIQLKFLKSSL